MGMFDSLKAKLKSFTGKVAKEAEVVPAKEAPPAKPAAPPAPPPPKPSAPAPAPATFEVVKKAPAPPTPPSAPAPAKEAPKPHVEVVRPTPESKKREAEHFDREMEKVVSPPPGTMPDHVVQGVEFEERRGEFIPAVSPGAEVLRPRDTPGLGEAERRAVAAPAAKPAAPKPAAPAPPAPAPQKGGKTINVENIEDLLWDLELSLLESDVALPVVEEIKERLKTNLANVRVGATEEIPQAVEGALRDAMLEVLSLQTIDFDTWLLERLMAKKPAVLMFVGVNGTGKTTTIGRVAARLKENGYTTTMAAGDTFRAGAIEQLTRHAEKLGVTIIKHQAGSDPAAVAYDAIEHAKSRLKDVVLLDTAGRMQTNTNLMDEMKKIKRVAQPDMIIFVGDSLAGNDAVEQAVKFNEAVGIDAVILTKVDTDAKGGAALSIAKAVGKPILFIGVGQEYGDLVPYDPRWMVNRIFEEAPAS